MEIYFGGIFLLFCLGIFVILLLCFAFHIGYEIGYCKGKRGCQNEWRRNNKSNSRKNRIFKRS